MKYQSIRLVVGEDFKELCHTHELDVEPIHCFSVQSTVQDILSFMYETKRYVNACDICLCGC